MIYYMKKKHFVAFLLSILLFCVSCEYKQQNQQDSDTVGNQEPNVKDSLAMKNESLVDQNKQAKEDSLLLQQLLKKDYKQYIGKPVEQFLALDVVKQYKRRIWDTGKPAYLQGLMLKMSDDFYVSIDVDDYKHIVNRVDTSYSWNFSLFKKEEITRITISFKGKDVLVVGPPLPKGTIMY